MSKINIQDLCDESHRLIRETIKTIGKIQEALLSRDIPFKNSKKNNFNFDNSLITLKNESNKIREIEINGDSAKKLLLQPQFNEDTKNSIKKSYEKNSTSSLLSFVENTSRLIESEAESLRRLNNSCEMSLRDLENRNDKYNEDIDKINLYIESLNDIRDKFLKAKKYSEIVIGKQSILIDNSLSNLINCFERGGFKVVSDASNILTRDYVLYNSPKYFELEVNKIALNIASEHAEKMLYDFNINIKKLFSDFHIPTDTFHNEYLRHSSLKTLTAEDFNFKIDVNINKHLDYGLLIEEKQSLVGNLLSLVDIIILDRKNTNQYKYKYQIILSQIKRYLLEVCNKAICDFASNLNNEKDIIFNSFLVSFEGFYEDFKNFETDSVIKQGEIKIKDSRAFLKRISSLSKRTDYISRDISDIKAQLL